MNLWVLNLLIFFGFFRSFNSTTILFLFPGLNTLLLRQLVPWLPHIPLTRPVMSPVKPVCQKTCFESGTERWILKLSLHYLSVQKCFFNKTILFLSFWFSVIYAFAGVCGMVDNKSEWPCIEWHTRCTALSLRSSDIVPLNHAATVNW